ncbi:hypothetical protein AB6A40_003603 [Gnathostoma spinigerum]|uniref:Uncharacterized protein n=1 Tax=Gnathostoma spinigerum TaxID=75299 RepID=A0ABD6EHT0_9BILA
MRDVQSKNGLRTTYMPERMNNNEYDIINEIWKGSTKKVAIELARTIEQKQDKYDKKTSDNVDKADSLCGNQNETANATEDTLCGIPLVMPEFVAGDAVTVCKTQLSS